MTFQEAIELRKLAKLSNRDPVSRIHNQVVINILSGYYDHLKDEDLNVANGDYQFLIKDCEL